MPVATTPSDSPRPSTLVKMEDRKRSAIGSTDDLAPPSKRVAVNGSKVKDDALEMKEETWVDAYTKGAIYRQMQEYSRKAQTAESRLEELHKRSVHHDDHLRIIDAWWRQVSAPAASLMKKQLTRGSCLKRWNCWLNQLSSWSRAKLVRCNRGCSRMSSNVH
jgi:hypothetical protein